MTYVRTLLAVVMAAAVLGAVTAPAHARIKKPGASTGAGAITQARDIARICRGVNAKFC